ncbi:MAG: hypothetical protein ACM3ZE_23490, partial [Myxococcales bacterium]
VALLFSVKGEPSSFASRLLGIEVSSASEFCRARDVPGQVAVGPEEKGEPRLGSIYTTHS